jgi:two-component system competent response regulator ComA
VNIAIVEKNSIYRESLQTALNQIADFKVVLVCSDCTEFYQNLNSINFNVLLLDYNIGDEKCMEILGRINQINPEVKVAIFTDYLQSCYYKHLIDSGADAVISKNSNKLSIEAQLRKIFAKTLT